MEIVQCVDINIFKQNWINTIFQSNVNAYGITYVILCGRVACLHVI